MMKEDRLQITINSILYILNRLGGKSDFLKVFKILYFAEKEHLSLYGRMFSENNYKSLPRGPVPDYAYDAMKSLRGDAIKFEEKEIFKQYFKVVDNHNIIAQAPEDLDELSISEIKCLDSSIQENRKLSFDQLSEKSHGSAWKSTPSHCHSSIIPLTEIAKEANLSDAMMKYSLEQEFLKNASFC